MKGTNLSEVLSPGRVRNPARGTLHRDRHTPGRLLNLSVLFQL